LLTGGFVSRTSPQIKSFPVGGFSGKGLFNMGQTFIKVRTATIGKATAFLEPKTKKSPCEHFDVHQGADESRLCRLAFTPESRIPYLGLLMGDHHH